MPIFPSMKHSPFSLLQRLKQTPSFNKQGSHLPQVIPFHLLSLSLSSPSEFSPSSPPLLSNPKLQIKSQELHHPAADSLSKSTIFHSLTVLHTLLHCYKNPLHLQFSTPKSTQEPAAAMAGPVESTRITLLLVAATLLLLPPPLAASLNSSLPDPAAVVADFHR